MAVGVDASDGGRQALEYGFEYALLHGSRLHAIHPVQEEVARLPMRPVSARPRWALDQHRAARGAAADAVAASVVPISGLPAGMHGKATLEEPFGVAGLLPLRALQVGPQPGRVPGGPAALPEEQDGQS